MPRRTMRAGFRSRRPSGSVRATDSHGVDLVRFLMGAKRTDGDDRLLWSRDIRFARRLADAVPSGRVFELDAGIVVIGPASELTDNRASQIAAANHSPPYGLVTLDASLPEG